MIAMGNQKLVSKKCEYALRAIFELVLNEGDKPMKTQEIAAAQDIPLRFLEVILVGLKHCGFISSKRGNNGGYILAREARDIVVGEVISFIDGRNNRNKRHLISEQQHVGDMAFSRLWNRVNTAISQIYKETTFQDLLEEEIAARNPEVSNYVI